MPMIGPVTTLADLPHPNRSLAAWAKVWRKPETARRQFALYGERFVMDVPLLPTMLWTSSPDDVRAVFQEKSRALSLGAGLRRFAPHEALFGSRIMDWWASDDHPVVRRKVANALMGKLLAGYEGMMEDSVRRLIPELPIGQPVRFHEHMQTLAREVIMSVVFGVFECERRRRLSDHLILLDQLIASRGLALRYAAALASNGHWLPFPALDRVLDGLDRVTYDEIAARRAAPQAERRDCLAALLSLQETGTADFVDDAMIAGFQRLLLVAGYDTTAATLTWVAERLVRHPGVLRRLDETLAEGDDTYLDAVISETLRLRPPVQFTVRAVQRDLVLNDMFLPRGSAVFLYINGIHHRDDLYDSPEEFRPERFMGDAPDPYRYLPFGGGVNRCPGGQMALFQTRVLLRTLLRDLAFVPSGSPSEVQQGRTGVLLPRNRATVTLRRR